MARLASPHQRTGAVAGLCTSKVGKRLERRRGSGTRPVSIVTGVEMARLRSKRRSSGICPAQGHRRMARLKSPHQRTGAVAGLCHGKVGKRLPKGPQGAAERQRDVADIEAAETPGGGVAGAGLPLKGAVCGSRLGLRKMRLLRKRRGTGICPVLNGAHQSTARGYAP